MKNKQLVVLIGTIASLIIFIALLILQRINASILELESRWLILAGAPILVALIVGGYIHKFKGFGLEIETRLQNRIRKNELHSLDALEQVEGQDKGTLSFLYDTPQEELAKKERLILFSGRKEYYGSFALKEYLEHLINLKYIEVRYPQGKFRCLIPAAVFKTEEAFNSSLLDRFIESLAGGNIYQDIEAEAETDFVKTSESLIAILPKVRESKHGWLPVLSKDRRLEGVVTKEAIESRIADEVMSAREIS
jgi:CBS domain-containing protein